MLYVSTESWQTRFHSSAPVSVLQGVLSEAPVRPRRLDFFLVSSPTGVGVKWGTSRQQRKWLTAAERLGMSTPCKDITRGCNSLSGMSVPRHGAGSPPNFEVCKHEEGSLLSNLTLPGQNCWTLVLLSGWKFHLWPISGLDRQRNFRRLGQWLYHWDWFKFDYAVSQTHHYMPQALLVFWLADGLHQMAQIPEIDASLV